MWPQNLPSISINFPFCLSSIHSIRPLSSTFQANAAHSVYFCHFPWCVNEAFCQLPVLLWHFRQFPPTFCAVTRDSVNIRQLFLRLQGHPSTLRVAIGPSVNFHYVRKTSCQPSMLSRDLSSTSVNIPCSQGSFRQHSAQPRDLNSLLCTVAGPSVNLCPFPCCQGTFCQLSSNFRAAAGVLRFSVNLPCRRGCFRQLLSKFRTDAGP